ncbi:MAG: HipA family kinase [Rhodothermales bacterium]
MNLRTVHATRYVTPLREGGSLPAIVEADDEGTYVLKFRGAGQGPKVLIAEVIAGELARAVGLPIPEIVLVELDPEMARTEPDPEIQALIRGSAGLNLAFDYLPGSITFDPVVDTPDADLASRIVWFDALMTNVDRTPRNPNLLMWHRRLWLIDHGACLYFHHAWSDYPARSRDRFAAIKHHVLLPFASALDAAADALRQRITPALIEQVVALVPDAWLLHDAPFDRVADHRAAYVDYLRRRLESPFDFQEEVSRARSLLV